jgi:hypothetical protein
MMTRDNRGDPVVKDIEGTNRREQVRLKHAIESTITRLGYSFDVDESDPIPEATTRSGRTHIRKQPETN